jgi:hypothetical protein
MYSICMSIKFMNRACMSIKLTNTICKLIKLGQEYTCYSIETLALLKHMERKYTLDVDRIYMLVGDFMS